MSILVPLSTPKSGLKAVPSAILSPMGSSALTRFVMHGAGQSQMDNSYSRGIPREALDYTEKTRAMMGLAQPRALQVSTSPTPVMVTDGTTRTSMDWVIRNINSSQGGSALCSRLAGDNALISGGLYWWNNDDNTAATGNPLDTADSPGPLTRQWAANITTYGIDEANWSHGGTDAGQILTQADGDLYEETLKKVVNYVRNVAGKTFPFFVAHHGRHNRNTDFGYQVISERQYKLATTPVGSGGLAFFYLASQEYYGRLANGVLYPNCSTTAGSAVVTFGDATGLAGNMFITGPGIPRDTYIVNPGGISGNQVTLTRPATATASGVTLIRMDDVHMYAGSDAVQPLDTASVSGGPIDSHNRLDGRYGLYQRMLRVKRLHFFGGTSQRVFGPQVVQIVASTGNNYFDFIVQHDQGSTLTTRNGGINLDTARRYLRATNNGTDLNMTNVALAQDYTTNGVKYSRVRVTIDSNLGAGSLSFWLAYGAMNRTDEFNFILDNATPYAEPVVKTSPTMNAAMTATLAPVTIAGAIDQAMPSAIYQVDATHAQSYGGTGQTVANIVGSPPDGQLATAYNFLLGTSSATEAGDPVFTGTAGNSGAYFAVNGSQNFTLSGSNPPFLANLHKSGTQKWWFAMTYYVTSATNGYLFSTLAATTLQGLDINSDTDVQLFQRGDTASVTASSSTFSPAISVPLNTPILLIVTYDAATGQGRMCLNSRTGSTFSLTFNATTTDATTVARIFSRNANNNYMPNGTRLKGLAMGNIFLPLTGTTNSIAALVDYYNNLHGTTYA